MSGKKISQKIIDYAIWYYLRYYPSRKKLAQKLRDKFGPLSEKGEKYGGIGETDISQILEEHMRNIIQEKEVLRAKIKNLQKKGKNINYIKTNLLQKYFEKKDIEEILEEEFHISETSFLDTNILHKKIENYKNQGKSRNYVRQKFIERSEDREVVENLLENIFLAEEEFENLKKEFEKLGGKEILKQVQNDRQEKQKIIEKLLRKGFLYDDIKKLLQM